MPTQREEIERIYEDKGLDALWDWAKGHPGRWKGLKKWAAAEAKRLSRELDAKRERIDRIEDELHELDDAIVDFRARLLDNERRLKKAIDEGDEKRIRQLESRGEELEREKQKLRARLDHKETKEKRIEAAAHKTKREKKAWIERKVIYREQWEKAKKRQKDKGGGFDAAEWEDWMGHGLDARVTPLVKKIIAWGILDYDLVATSLRRNFVPPGGSTTSFHLQGRAGDIAGSRVTEFQQAAYEEFKGNAAVMELFGPTNHLGLKFGTPLALAEGTALETLHDTHVHVAA